MSQDYPIRQVGDWPKVDHEPLGTKSKLWLEDEDKVFWLFKYNRPNTGDDWAEKVGAEVAELLRLPHAVVELAELDSRLGVISRDFTQRHERGVLLHGNEILLTADPDYPAERRFRVAQHTVERVLHELSWEFIKVSSSDAVPGKVETPGDLFLGYLMLDALIGNTDRHHENWGVLVESEPVRIELAPTFDHASCLGQIITDQEREKRLTARDKGYSVEAYVRRARSALYANEGDKKPLSPLAAFLLGAERRQTAARYWREVVASIDIGVLLATVKRVPGERISDPARRFACRMLECNRANILEAKLP